MNNLNEIKYQTLNLEQFAGGVEGYDPITFESKSVSLEVGDIKYYDGIPYTLSKQKMEYYYILATVEAPRKEYEDRMIDKIVGMIQLQKSPHEENVLWLNFISVDPEYKNKGIGKQLSQNMCKFLSDKPWSLERSRPSDDGVKYIKSIIDDFLEKYKIKEIPRPKY